MLFFFLTLTSQSCPSFEQRDDGDEDDSDNDGDDDNGDDDNGDDDDDDDDGHDESSLMMVMDMIIMEMTLGVIDEALVSLVFKLQSGGHRKTFSGLFSSFEILFMGKN